MAVNLINSNDITVTQTGDNIQLETPNIGDITNLTTTNKSSIVDAINEINGEIPDIYSTNEVKTNKVWIDNKPIYKKTFVINSISSSNNNLADISSLNIDKVVNYYGILSTTYNDYTIPFSDSSSNYNTIFINQKKYIRGRAVIGDTGSFASAHITIEYTKTTD